VKTTGAKSRAEKLLFRREEKKSAISDYEMARRAEQEKTARLKALRLAKEAEDEEARKAVEAKTGTAPKKPKSKRK